MKKRMIITIVLACVLTVSSGCGENKNKNVEEKVENEINIDENTVADSAEDEAGEEVKTTEEVEVSEAEELSETTEEEETSNEVSIVMVGDILLHTPLEENNLTDNGTYDFSSIFAEVEDDISAADIAIVNQEVIIGGEELGISGYPNFNAPYEIGNELAETGFDVICHGTNHALDKGEKGIDNCVSFWRENYPEIEVLGVYDNAEDYNSVYITEMNGIRIAILNYTYGTNGISLPVGREYMVDLLNEGKVKADIAYAEENADFTIVCPHWGTEYNLEIDDSQKYWASFFEENGVDLVIGTHPHVIEPIEMIKNEETGHEMLTYYSLGNFVNWTSGTGEGVAKRMVGGMAEIIVEMDEDGNAKIKGYGVEPLVCQLSHEKNSCTVYKFEDYTKELAESNAFNEQTDEFSYEYIEKLIMDVWGNTNCSWQVK